MCRQGLINTNEPQDVTNFIVASSSVYSKTQSDGFGLAYFKNNKLTVEKTKLKAMSYWLFTSKKIASDSVIFHTRTATSGGISDSTSHPFYGKSVALTHNGVLYNYMTFKNELETENHIGFNTTVDSEVIFRAYQKYGWDMIQKFDEFNVGGYMALQILERDKTFVYRTPIADYGLWEGKNVIIGMSDSVIFPVRQIPENTIITIQNGEIIAKDKTESIASKKPTYEREYWDSKYNESYWYGYGHKTTHYPWMPDEYDRIKSTVSKTDDYGNGRDDDEDDEDITRGD